MRNKGHNSDRPLCSRHPGTNYVIGAEVASATTRFWSCPLTFPVEAPFWFKQYTKLKSTTTYFIVRRTLLSSVTLTGNKSMFHWNPINKLMLLGPFLSLQALNMQNWIKILPSMFPISSSFPSHPFSRLSLISRHLLSTTPYFPPIPVLPKYLPQAK